MRTYELRTCPCKIQHRISPMVTRYAINYTITCTVLLKICWAMAPVTLQLQN